MLSDTDLARITELIKAIELSPLAMKFSVDGDSLVTARPRRSKVAIVAFGPTSAHVRDFSSEEYEVWCINNGYYQRTAYDADGLLRADRWFEIHQMHAQPADDLVWMNHCPVPIYVADVAEARKYGPIPNAIAFPAQAIEARFGLGPWWACTFAYQIALAIVEGFSEIVLLGMEFGSAREFIMERPNVLWWAGLAHGLGIKIVTPSASTLFEHPYRYGLEYDHEKLWCDRKTEDLIKMWGWQRTAAGERQRREYEQGLLDAIPPPPV